MPPTRLLPVALALCIARAATLFAADAVRIDVEFRADGRCAVAATGEGVHAALTYAPWSSSGPRCAVPPIPKGRTVELTVRVPAAAVPSDSAFPRLSWRQADNGWIGTATLPAAPAFVRVPPTGAAAAANEAEAAASRELSPAFGWNFYGWFLFSAVFIGAYFVWAQRMAARDGRRLP
jgi:hypothetical protein